MLWLLLLLLPLCSSCRAFVCMCYVCRWWSLYENEFIGQAVVLCKSVTSIGCMEGKILAWHIIIIIRNHRALRKCDEEFRIITLTVNIHKFRSSQTTYITFVQKIQVFFFSLHVRWSTYITFVQKFQVFFFSLHVRWSWHTSRFQII